MLLRQLEQGIVTVAAHSTQNHTLHTEAPERGSSLHVQLGGTIH